MSKHQRQQLWKQFGFRTKTLEHLIAHIAAITIHYCHIEIGLTCHLIRESIISSCHLSTILKTVCQSTSRLCHQKIRTQLNVVQKIWGETSSTRHYPKLKQFYSLTERFLYDYDYEFKLPVTCNYDLLVAKASQDLSAYSIYEHQIFQLSFNFLHPTPKDVQNNNYRVHETKLIHNLIYYTFLRDKNHNTSKSYIHLNDQLTSPYFLNY